MSEWSYFDEESDADFNPELTLDRERYIWCKDSETGESVLLDRKTNQIIAKRK